MSRLDNFKGRVHKLTQEDRVKGGRMSSAKKTQANSVKNLIHGKNSDKIYFLLTCMDYPAIGRCNKVSDGYCYYLLEEMRLNMDFSKQVATSLYVEKNKLDPISFLQKKYALNKEYLEKLFPTEQNSDSKG
jgi:hypothetical protein